MRPLLPAFSRYFHLHPPLIYDLTPQEMQPYLDALDDLQTED